MRHFPRRVTLARSTACGSSPAPAHRCVDGSSAPSCSSARRRARPRRSYPHRRRALRHHSASRPRRVAPPSLGIFQGTTDVGRPSTFGPGALATTRARDLRGHRRRREHVGDGRPLPVPVAEDVGRRRHRGVGPVHRQSARQRRSEPHRKACLVIRQSLDSSGAYADAALHADGLTSLQWRDAPRRRRTRCSPPSVVRRLRIEKRGEYVTMSVAEGAEPLRPSGGAAKLALGPTSTSASE